MGAYIAGQMVWVRVDYADEPPLRVTASDGKVPASAPTEGKVPTTAGGDR